MKAKNTGLIIFICIILAALAIAALSVVNLNAGQGQGQRLPARIKRVSGEYIACVYLSGVIEENNRSYSQEWLLSTIESLREDRNNLGIILFVDSPGGTVYEADEAYLALRDYTGTGKRLWAYFGRLAASGAYYVACAAEHIAANRNSLTGSIGVIAGQSIDLTGLMARYGIKVTTFTAGRNKNMLNFNSPLTQEQRAIMQSIADECYAQFVGIVAEARNLSLKEAQNRSDGRIYTAKQALGAGLLDEIGSFDDVADKLIGVVSGNSLARRIEIVDFRYEPRKTFAEYLTATFRLIPEMETLKTVPRVAFPAYLCLEYAVE
jgi:protease-4